MLLKFGRILILKDVMLCYPLTFSISYANIFVQLLPLTRVFPMLTYTLRKEYWIIIFTIKMI